MSDCKIVEQWYQPNGDLVSKWKCGHIDVQGKPYPDGWDPGIISTVTPLGVDCELHRDRSLEREIYELGRY